jgi:hypothetical protein
LAGQLAHESYVRPGPLVLGTAFLRSPAAASDRDRTVSRVISRITTGTDYTFTLFLGAGVLRRPCSAERTFLSCHDAVPSLLLARKSLQGHNAPCHADVALHPAAENRFEGSNGLGFARTRNALSLRWPSLGIALTVLFGRDSQGSTDMSRWAPRNYSLGTQLSTF